MVLNINDMNNNTLTPSDIMDLISEYKSEVRKLTAKISFCESRIMDLENMLNPDSASSKKGSISISNQRSEKKRGRISHKSDTFSGWDRIVMDVIREQGMAQISCDIYDKAIFKSKVLGLYIDEEKSKSKINQSLVKLANRRSDLKKVKYGGRGYAYCLPEWLDDNGRLKKEHNHMG